MPTTQITWQESTVTSPHIPSPVSVLIAKDVPYLPSANRLQNLTIYLPINPSTSALLGQPVTSLPITSANPPATQIHIHGGAWRDPHLLSSSISAAAAHTFSAPNPRITTIISLNYALSPFPSHPTAPYDTTTEPRDSAREGVHPAHIHDILAAFRFLRKMGLKDDSFVLTGHSAGACLAMQAALFPASHWGLGKEYEVPRPAAVVGMNGLYDLEGLVSGLGDGHAHLAGVYEDLITRAFGEREGWVTASPVGFEREGLAARIEAGRAVGLVVVSQSTGDQLVPENQAVRLRVRLQSVQGLEVMVGTRCTGVHAAPWEQGYMIWEEVQDVLDLLARK